MTDGPCNAAASYITAIAESQYVSIKYTQRLAEAGVEPSVGSVGDSYDNALAETINGLYKAEVIHRRGPWRSFETLEIRDPGMSGLIQKSTAARANRQHTASRSRGALLRHRGRPSHGGLTQTKQPPAYPARFKPSICEPYD
jgi:transposase InsO family protein